MWKPLTALLFVFGCGSGPSNDSAPSRKISSNDFNDEWPLSVNEGVVKCVDELYVVFEANGKTYAINGSAKGERVMAERGYVDIDEIWMDDPNLPGAKMNIGPIIDIGLELCK